VENHRKGFLKAFKAASVKKLLAWGKKVNERFAKRA